MCGIFGVTNDTNAPQTILLGLKRLEYRGYDSWGIAVKGKDTLNIEKNIGKISNTVTSLKSSTHGVGHTRWATHGGVTINNSHPHLDCTGKLAVVHNGIIDNWQTLLKEINGHDLNSQTDSEVIAHLIENELDNGVDYFQAFSNVFSKLRGCNAVILIHQDYPYLLAGKTGSPLVIGVLKGNNLIASDISSLLPLTRDIIFLEDGQLAKIGQDSIDIYNSKTLKNIPFKIHHINWSANQQDKGEFSHFMLKEINEQPEIIDNLIKSKTYEIEHFADLIKSTKEIYTIACGSAAYAAMMGEYFFSRIAKSEMRTVIGSEFLYHSEFLGPKSLLIALSQSGETIDTLQSVGLAKKKKSKIVSFINVPGSSLERQSDQAIFLEAGAEKAVASTKAFLAKVVLLFMTAYAVKGKLKRGVKELGLAAVAIRNILKPDNIAGVKNLASIISTSKNMFVIGRGQSYPAALEIALKIKEVSYIHAEGLAAGELKHGPIALIEKGTPCIILDPNDETSADILSSAMEVKARGAYVIGVGVNNNKVFDYWLPVDDSKQATILPIIVTGQLLAYYLALANNADPDMPRNLAKSVTVK